MSREIDERIVEMQFDNRQFESGVAETIRSLDKLDESLRFDDLRGSFSTIQNGINGISFEPIQSALLDVGDSLISFTDVLKYKVFDKIADMAVNTGSKLVNTLTLGSAKAGMQEYETQQGSVQTILANTQHLGTTVKDVVGALDELNEYADLTIYNFTQMTRNIGTFTAAGLDLETSTSAIKGISNLAAISGSTSAQASTAMYQLSQALSAGRVSLQDWNSVVNAGMGGKVFQDALKKTAKHMGIVVDESKSFRESIGGGDSWLSAEVLSETLKQLSGDMTDAELAAQGWSATEIEEIQKMAKSGMEAATVVKTYSQLIDTLTEQIGSGWTKTWQLIFGDFEESKALWTSVYQAISPYIDAFSDLRNKHIEFWRENEGRDKVLKAFSNIWSGITETIDSFTTKIKVAFPIFDNMGQKLVDLSDDFLKFSERFRSVKKVSEDAAKTVTKTVSTITEAEKAAARAIWEIGKYGNGEDRVKNLEAEGLSYEKVQGYLNALIDTNFDAAAADERFTETVVDTTEAVNDLAEVKKPTILENIVSSLKNIGDIAKNIITNVVKIGISIKSAFLSVVDFAEIFSRFSEITGKVKGLTDQLDLTDSAIDKITRSARGFFSIFKIIGDALYGAGSALVDIFAMLVPSVKELGGNLLGSSASLGDLIYEFSQTHDIATTVHDTIMKVVSVFTDFSSVVDNAKTVVSNFFNNLFSKIKDKTGIDIAGFLESIKISVLSLFDSIKNRTGIDIVGIFNNTLSGLGDVLSKILHLDFKGAFDLIVDSFVSFKKSIQNTVDNADPNSIFGKFINAMRTVVGVIGDVLKGLFSSSNDTVADEVEDRFNFFEWIGETLGNIGEYLGEAISFIGELLSEVFGFVSGFLTEGFEEDDTAFEKVKKIVQNIGELASEILKIIAPFAGLSMAKDLTSLPAAVSGFVNSAGEAMEAVTKKFTGGNSTIELINKLVNAILKLAIAVFMFALLDESNIAVATASMTFIIGELIGALVIMQKYLKTDIDYALLTVAMSQIASAMFKLALSVALLALFNPAKVATGTGAVVVLIASIVGALVAMQKWLKADIDFTKVTMIFTKIAYTIMILSLVVAVLAHKDPIKLAAATGSVTVLLFAIVGVVSILQKTYNPAHGQTALKNMSYIASLAIAIAQAVKMMVPAINSLGNMDPDKMMYGLLGVTNILLVLTGIMYLLAKIKMGSDAIQTAIALIAATVAVKMLTDSAVELGKEGSDKVLAAAGGIYAMVGALAALVGLMILISKISTPAQIVAVSLSLLAAVYALTQLTPVVIELGKLKPKELGTALLGLVGALATLALVLAALSYVGGANVLLVAVGLFILAEAISVLVPPMIKFGKFIAPIIDKLVNTKWKTIGKGFAIVAAGLVAMVVAAPVLAIFGAGLLIVAAALAVISVSMSIAAGAFSKFASALILLGAAWPMVKNILPELGKQLGVAAINAITAFIQGLTGVFKAIKEMAPEIASTIKTVILTVIELLTSSVPEIVSYLLKMFTDILTQFAEDLPTILKLIGMIFDTILNWLMANVETWSKKLTIIISNIIIGALNGLTEKVDDLVAAFANFIIAFNNALSKNINEKGDKILKSIWNVLVALFNLLKRALVALESKIEKVGGDVIDYIVTGVSNAKDKVVEKIKTIFTDDIPDKINEIWGDLQKIGEQIIDAAVEGITNSAYKLGEAVKSLGRNAVNALTGAWDENSPSEETYKAGEYFVQGAVDATNDHSSDLSDATGLLGEDALNEFANTLGDNSDFDFNPTVNITPDANIDMTNVDSAISGIRSYDVGDLDILGSSDFMSGLDLTSMLGSRNSELDAQNLQAREENNELLTKLNDNMKDLVHSFSNGMINIPDNATFNVPVNIDGQTVANVTAPYLDVINGEKMDLESMGVTSR